MYPYDGKLTWKIWKARIVGELSGVCDRSQGKFSKVRKTGKNQEKTKEIWSRKTNVARAFTVQFQFNPLMWLTWNNLFVNRTSHALACPSIYLRNLMVWICYLFSSKLALKSVDEFISCAWTGKSAGEFWTDSAILKSWIAGLYLSNMDVFVHSTARFADLHCIEERKEWRRVSRMV